MSSLFGGKEAIARPKVKVKFKGSWDSENFLYDSGAQISLISKKAFRKISIGQRPEKLKINLQCSGVSGAKLSLKGCYFLNVNILGQVVKHPFFVSDVPGHAGVLGIDIIKKTGLSYDATTNIPYFPKKSEPARLARDIYLPARSATLVPINTFSDEVQSLSINVPGCHQVYANEVLLQPKDKRAHVYLHNVSTWPQKLPKGIEVGQLEGIRTDELIPWSTESPWKVEATTPKGNSAKLRPAPPLDAKRKQQILEKAKLDHLPTKLKDEYLKLLFNNHECISVNEFELGVCNKGAHSIPTLPNAPPIYQKQFPLAIEYKKEVRRQVLEWLKIGIIRPCESNWNSSLFLVKKKLIPGQPQTWRVVQDLRPLNKATVASNFRLPEIHECLDRIAAKKPSVYSSLDLRSGYHQLPIEESSQEKTAFTCLSLGQQFCFKVTSMGLAMAPASFARAMTRVFYKQIARNDVECYLDDVLAYGTSHQDMLRILKEAFQNLKDSGMLLNLEKCQFGVGKLTYLGFEIDKDGFRADPTKSEAITKVQEPNTLKGIRSFLGMANFYRILIPRFSQLMKPLTRLTCKDANWSGGELTPEAKMAFDKCKEIFSTQPFLHFPNFNWKMHLLVDASLGNLDEPDGGLACCLVQYPNDDTSQPPRPIGFASRSLQKHEKNYSAHLIETSGIIFGVEFFEKYLRTPFVIHTDHKPLTTVSKIHKRTLERFREILAHYDFTLQYTEGKDMPADYLSRHTKVESETEKVQISSVELGKEFSDWAGVQQGKEKVRENAKVESACEESACVTCKNCKTSETLEGTESARVESAWEDCKKCRQEEKFEVIENAGVDCKDKESAWVTDQNSKPDLAESCEKSLVTANKPKKKSVPKRGSLLTAIKNLCVHAVHKTVETLSMAQEKSQTIKLLKLQQKEDPFIIKLKTFLKDKILPTGRYRNIIKRWGPHCYEKKGLIMIRHERAGYPTRELLVAPASKIADLIASSHSSLLGGHDGVDKTAQRLLQSHWFPGLYSEVNYFIDNCPVCIKMKKKAPESNTYLHSLKQPDQVFERCHLDLFGPIQGRDKSKKYILTCVDAFSKFAIFKAIENKEAKTVAKAFFEHWVTIFGSPLSIVTDMGTDFHTQIMKELCGYMQIEKLVASPQHPQSNAQAEVLNKKLRKYLTAMVENDPLEWEKYLSSCQYAHNLSVHKAIKNSPYTCLFGVDGNTPLNHTGFVSKPIYGEEMHHNMLNRLKAARQLAKKNNMEFRDDYVKRFNEKVKPYTFGNGQLVYLFRPELLKINPKLMTPWFGPFVILSMIGDTNALIQDLESRRTKLVNTNRLRHYDISTEQWAKLKISKTAPPKTDTHSPSGQPEKVTNTIARPSVVEFQADNEVTILTPDSIALPKPSVKLEVTDSPTSNSEEDNEIPTGNGSLIDYSSATSLPTFTDVAKTLTDMVIPPKSKFSKTKIKIANLPSEATGRLTRSVAERANAKPPSVHNPDFYDKQQKFKK